ncbi:hypothetical protein GCM10009841_33010 [Microlunatus panaciterrae]|uniref:DUF1918 domain-containing protein n=1 Tax=Microlunatus panaciterrae TaxID=400768 RepID=A0ABS2RJ14_9ACTN|nr:dsRBD fold-containing protein [Microlunatus panaciterrae]MBM7797959.1 hypothetical protein [Microlunatus panaciterrae]
MTRTQARVGDRIFLASNRTGVAVRTGEVLEIQGPDGGPPYLVRWTDGHTGLFYPGPGTSAQLTPHDPDGPPAAVHEGTAARVREWQVRVSVYESGDDTSAVAVLSGDTPVELTARGFSHRSGHDPAVARIGDEVAAARALRHLADTLLETAASDIAGSTGEEPIIRAT